jgi:tetratricopeptide (TPR) repeat protein
MMIRLVVAMGLFGVAACSTPPKVVVEKPLTGTELEARRLAPFLGAIDPDAEEGARRPLLVGAMLLQGWAIDEVLAVARRRGEGPLVEAALLARKGAVSEALQVAGLVDRPAAIRQLAGGWLAKGKREQVKSLLAQSADASSQAPLKAWIDHLDGRTEVGVKSLRSYLYEHGTDLLAYVVLARIHAQQGELRLARLVCKEGLKQGASADLHYMLGRVEAQRGKKVASRRAMEAALVVQPAHLGAHSAMARSQLEQLDYAGALKHTTVAYRLAPGDPEIALLHALALRANGRCDRAGALLLPLAENYPVARLNLGVLQLRCLDNAAGAATHLKAYVQDAKPKASHPVHQLLMEAEALSE